MNTIALCLTLEANEYQQMVKADVIAAAERAGMKAAVYFSEDRITDQVKQIHGCTYAPASSRPKAIIVMPARDNALNRMAHDAVRAGIGWICLHRRMDNLHELRQQFPTVPISFVSPDQREIGRIQGRQFKALLPNGGRVLYVHGNTITASAKERLEGMRETIRGTNIEEAGAVDGNWTAEDAERTVGGWLRIVMSGRTGIDLVGCQNDAMALGALKALKSVGDYLRRPEIALIPVTGCDGLPNFGRKLVDQNQLVATVCIPSTGGPAVNLIVRALNQNELPPEELILSSTSHPDERVLAERGRTLK